MREKDFFSYKKISLVQNIRGMVKKMVKNRYVHFKKTIKIMNFTQE